MEMLDCTSETYNQLKQSDLRDLHTHAHAYTHASTWEIMTPIYESNTAAPCSSQRMYITMDGSLKGGWGGRGKGWLVWERERHTHTTAHNIHVRYRLTQWKGWFGLGEGGGGGGGL